ncbi:MAG: hypothetical protein AB8B85_08610 [Paracoccaceae bacterium]
MAGRPASRYLWLLLFLIPGVLLYFALNSAIYRYNIRADAIEMQATVEDYVVESYTCKDSDGNARTRERIAYDLILDVNGDRMKRPLLEGNFDPADFWHSKDMISPAEYPRGSQMDVLVRPDLGYLVSIDNFWNAYMLPLVLGVFGGFWFVGFSFIVPSMIRDG